MTVRREAGRGAAVLVSVCVIARDEEARLPRCLRSALPLADELVVVDTGSCDSTADVARSLGARVLRHCWSDDFSAARNVGLEAAGGQWILWLDADEELVDACAVRRLLEREPATVNAWQLLVFSAVGSGGDGGLVITPEIRLFRNDPRCRFDYAIHEQLRPTPVPMALHRGPGRIHHHGYVGSAASQREKVRRNRRIAVAQLNARPDDGFVVFSAGSEALRDGDVGEALTLLRRAYALLGAEPQPFAAQLAATYSAALSSSGSEAAAVEVLQRATRQHPTCTDLHYLLGCALRRAGDPTGAVRSLLRALELGDEGDPRYRTEHGRGSSLCLWELGQAYCEMGDVRSATGAFQGAARATSQGHLAGKSPGH